MSILIRRFSKFSVTVKKKTSHVVFLATSVDFQDPWDNFLLYFYLASLNKKMYKVHCDVSHTGMCFIAVNMLFHLCCL